jgi:FkbM family methyltransferase
MYTLSARLEEQALRSMVEQADSGDLVVFDVGANHGTYVDMILDPSIGRKATIHAFEPDPELAKALVTRFSGNTQVHITAAAVSDASGEVTFHRYEQDVLSGLYDRAEKVSVYRNPATSRSFTVPTLTLDAYCAERGIERISHLKIDTEGHDLYVLKGAQRLIQEGRIDHLQFEFSEMNILSRSTFLDHWEILSPHFDLYRLCLDGLYRIERYDPLLLEVYHVVNFVAKRRR